METNNFDSVAKWREGVEGVLEGSLLWWRWREAQRKDK